MPRLVLATALGVALAAPAWATGTISCVSEDGATIDMTIGSLPVLAVVSAHIQSGGEAWSTLDNQIVVGQAYGDAEQVRVDFTDEIVNAIVARLRLFRVLDGTDFAMAGTLQIVDHGAYAVTCIGP